MSYVFAASAAVTAGLGIYKTIKGNNAVADAKRRAKLNVRPDYPIQQQYYDNQNLAASQAQSGLSDAERNYYNTNAQRGFSSGIAAGLQTGQGPNAVGSLYDSFLRGQGAIANTSDQLKTQKLQTLMGANTALADQETQKWALDKYEPFKDEARAISGQKTAGQQQVNDGLNTIGSAVSSYAAGTTKYGDAVNNATNLGREQGAMPELATASEGVNADPSVQGTAPITFQNQIPEDAINSTRGAALDDIKSKYAQSPYLAGLSGYLNPQ